MAPRFALYLAPETGSTLWRFGSGLLGYDAATGQALAFPAIPGIAPETWQVLTEDLRRYGFHLTMKAPFHLAEGVTVAALEQSAPSARFVVRSCFPFGDRWQDPAQP